MTQRSSTTRAQSSSIPLPTKNIRALTSSPGRRDCITLHPSCPKPGFMVGGWDLLNWLQPRGNIQESWRWLGSPIDKTSCISTRLGPVASCKLWDHIIQNLDNISSTIKASLDWWVWAWDRCSNRFVKDKIHDLCQHEMLDEPLETAYIPVESERNLWQFERHESQGHSSRDNLLA